MEVNKQEFEKYVKEITPVNNVWLDIDVYKRQG